MRTATKPIFSTPFEPLEQYKTVSLDGSGDFVSTPDSASNSVTTEDLTAIMWVRLLDYSLSTQSIVAHWAGSGNQRGWMVRSDNSGRLQFLHSPDGTSGAVVTSTSSSTIPVSDGAEIGLRCTLTNGSSTSNLRMYSTSAHATTALDDVSWAQLGATLSHDATGNIHNSTADFTVGALADASNEVGGEVTRVVLIKSTDPTAAPIVDMDPRDWRTGNSWISKTGETWTLQGNARMVNA